MGELNEAVRGANDLRAAAVGTQLTGFDAAAWRAAAGDRTMRSSILSLTLFDSTPDWDRVRQRYERLTRVVPMLRERPLFGAVGVSMPRLAVDPDFDLDIHLHRMRLASGGGWEDVLREARRMSLTDFDHDRPLWEAQMIEGLPGGRAAMIVKLHHAIADGQATVKIFANLLEISPEGNPDEPEAPAAPVAAPVAPTSVSRANIQDNVSRVLGAAASGARLFADLAMGTLKDPVGTWGEAVEMAGSIGRFTATPESALSPIMARRSTTYRFATFDLPFTTMRVAARKRGNTVNDLFLGSVATGAAKYHERHNRPARRLRFNMPISLRSAAKDGSANAVTIARFELPVNGASVDERIKVAHEEVRRWRDEPALALANPLAEVSWVLPVPVIASVAKTSDLTASNVPGPPIAVYSAGARIVGTWPLVPPIGAAANITLVSYDGYAFVGVSADEAAIPDLDDFISDLRAGFVEVIGAPVGPTDPNRPGRHDHPSYAAEVRASAGGSVAAAPKAESPGKPAAEEKAPAKRPAAKKSTGVSPQATAAKQSPAKTAAKKSTRTPSA